jgi:hypothetical protein
VRPTRTATMLAAAALVLLAGCGSNDSAGAGPAGSAGPTTPAGNGVESKTPKEIIAAAKDALSHADSVHVAGTATGDGQSVTIDVKIKGSAGGAGSITLEGKKVDILRVGRTVYMKADQAFWTSITGNAQAAKLLNGKYLKSTTSDQKLKQIAAFTDVSGLADGVLKAEGTVTKGDKKTVNGTEAIGLVDSAGGGTLYVATTGKPYPLEIAPAPGSSDSGKIDFTDYGKDVDLTAPPAASVIDVAKLGG